MEEDAARAAQRGDLFDRKKDAGFVVRPHERDARRLGRDGILQVGDREQTVAVHWQAGDPETRLLQFPAECEDGRVLDRRGDDVPLRRVRARIA